METDPPTAAKPTLNIACNTLAYVFARLPLLPHDGQLSLPGVADEERRQRERDRRHWAGRLQDIERELESEPDRVRAGYAVRAHRLEPVGLVYLWPVTG